MTPRSPNLHVITGGAGFIGSNIAAALDEQDAGVAIIDLLGSDDKWRNIGKRRLADLVAPDETFAALDEMTGKIASVIHMGAISSTTERNADLIVETNFRYSCRLWNWCAAHNVTFIYASSAATYGDGAAGFDDDNGAQRLARLNPLNAYGWSKHLFDRWATDRAIRGEPSPPRWAGLKFFNVFGPNEYHKGGQRSVAVQFFEQIRGGRSVRLFASDNPAYPDGGQKRDFVWVGDCADIVLWLLQDARPNGIYNAGSGTARSFADLSRAVYAAMELSPSITYIPMPDELKGRYQYFTQARMTKLASAGYSKSTTSLEEGIRQYVRNFLMSEDRYR